MAICPFAVQQIIPESHTQGRIRPTTLIFHRAVSSAESLYNYWTTPGVELESHFYIGREGTIYQFMDTEIRADANVDANAFAISVETWDGGNTPDSMGWNDKQLAAAKRLAAWVCSTHGIKRAPATTWNGGGIGGHNWFPYPWAGGPRGCPGTERNRQLREEIIPFVADGGSAEEDDMTPDDLLNATVRIEGDAPNAGKDIPLRAIFGWSDSNFMGLQKANASLLAKLDALVALVGQLAKDPALTPGRAAEIVEGAVAKANAAHLAAQKAQIDAMLVMVREIVAARDEDLADEVVDQISRRTARAATA